jgi:hypothetical protein
MKSEKAFYLKTLIISIAIFFAFAFKTQQEVYPEQINWDTHFLAKPDKNSAFAALTATKWHYSYKSTIKGNNLHIDFNFSAGVVPTQSWVKPDKISNKKVSKQLLNHEQGHVYINFLLLKEGENQIENQKYTIANYKKLIQLTANKIGKYYSDLQSKYDDETKHGADLEAQAKWDDYIRNEMNRYQ